MSGFRSSVVLLSAFFCGGAFVQAGVESSGALSGPSFLRIEARQGGGWKTMGQLRLGLRSSERSLELKGLGDDTTLRLSCVGTTRVYLDELRCGGLAPNSGLSGKELGKLAGADLDLFQMEGGHSVILGFPGGAGGVLSIVGRAAPLAPSRVPFRFPLSDTYLNPRDFGSFYHVGFDKIDSKFGENFLHDSSMTPLFSVMTRPGSGHPDALTMGWVDLEDGFLRASIDFLPDNTNESEDYAVLYVRTPGGLRSFTISEEDRRWGSGDFIYTPRVAYEHSVYEFRVPLSALGLKSAKAPASLDLAFAAYGTVSAPAIIDEFNAPSGGGQSVVSGPCTLGTDDVPFPGSIFGSQREMAVVSGTPVADINSSLPGYLNADFQTSAGTIQIVLDGADGDCSAPQTAVPLGDLSSVFFDRIVLVQTMNAGSAPVDVQVVLHTVGGKARATYSSVIKTIPPGGPPANIEFLYATDFPGLGDLSSVSAVELILNASVSGALVSADSLRPSMGSVPVELLSFTVNSGE